MKRALFSVTDKSDLDFFAKGLVSLYPDLEIIASGGTADALQKAKIPFTPLSQKTGFPECFGGRVKTLHPKIFGGILYRRGVDDEEAARLGIEPIDLVVCNLYAEDQIDSIDIGGSSMIRAACKNFASVAILVDKADYLFVLSELKEKKTLSLETRKNLALKAMRLSASYEQKIVSKLDGDDSLSIFLEKGRKLSYGENPDQEGWVYGLAGQTGVASAKVLGGKPLSYNNLEDASAAFWAIQKICHSPACAVIKHGSLCGYATGRTQIEAFQRAWDGDPKSAFGSIIALSQEAGPDLCGELASRFIEVVLAPSFDPKFIDWALKAKPSLRLLQVDYKSITPKLFKSIAGGLLVQTAKKAIFPSIEKLFLPLSPERVGVATKRSPKKEQLGLYSFAVQAVQAVKSNAIVLVREYSPQLYQLIGVGGGQPNRIDSLQRLAIPRAIENLKKEMPEEKIPQALGELVLASDGFFPFADSIKAASDLGIKAFIQPGGSMRDNEVIETADQQELSMVFTGERYFNH